MIVPRVASLSATVPRVPSSLTSVPVVPSLSMTVPGVPSLQQLQDYFHILKSLPSVSSFSVTTSSFSSMSLSLQQLFAMPYKDTSSELEASSIWSSRPLLRQNPHVEQVLTTCWQYIKSLRPNQQCKVLSALFDLYVQESTTLKCTPNLVELAVKSLEGEQAFKRDFFTC